MKSVILLFFSISLNVFSQNIKSLNDSLYVISKYESNDLEKQGEQLRKILDLKKDNLIINLNDSKYICLIDNTVFCKVICSNKLINTIKLDKIKSDSCITYIKKLIELNPSDLMVDVGENGNKLHIEDGGNVTIKIFKSDKKLILDSFSPYTYIREKFPFFEKRMLFVESYSKLLRFFYDEEFYRIKALDTLYVYIERSKKEKQFVNINLINNARSTEYHLTFGDLSVNFTNYFLRENAILSMDKKQFFNNNKIVRLDYLNKFCTCDLDKLISSRGRIVYLIDSKDFKRGKVKLKEVKGSSQYGWNCYD
jgi:hypothetical protein